MIFIQSCDTTARWRVNKRLSIQSEYNVVSPSTNHRICTQRQKLLKAFAVHTLVTFWTFSSHHVNCPSGFVFAFFAHFPSECPLNSKFFTALAHISQFSSYTRHILDIFVTSCQLSEWFCFRVFCSFPIGVST